MRSHIRTASSMLWVTMRMERTGSLDSIHRSMRSVRSVSAVSTSSAEKGSSISRRSGWTTRARARAHALAHAAGHFLGVGVLVAAEADEVDGFLGAAVAFGAGHTLGFQAEFHVFLDGEPGEERKLWKTMATPSAGPLSLAPCQMTSPAVVLGGRRRCGAGWICRSRSGRGGRRFRRCGWRRLLCRGRRSRWRRLCGRPACSCGLLGGLGVIASIGPAFE